MSVDARRLPRHGNDTRLNHPRGPTSRYVLCRGDRGGTQDVKYRAEDINLTNIGSLNITLKEPNQSLTTKRTTSRPKQRKQYGEKQTKDGAFENTSDPFQT